jgi:hypothetical protein
MPFFREWLRCLLLISLLFQDGLLGLCFDVNLCQEWSKWIHLLFGNPFVVGPFCFVQHSPLHHDWSCWFVVFFARAGERSQSQFETGLYQIIGYVVLLVRMNIGFSIS